ncbi:hypothetical protein ROV94_15685 [Stenotrophomonas maltophilia]|uniref:hypothetical protein n=1 Tax=Stenotrophomonas maltophilia TaxID=40324 RepID=UPI0028938621|nr:hypothetical protein [Stenotrophomonas maltophilia]MDT3432309.1 hypothetical protein [Stenotrophomonas maltophilia]
MSNDNKTLADVQPGGMVRLATVPYDRARDLMGDAYNAGTHGMGYGQQAMELHDAIIPAQPSPGGQGGALASLPLYRLADDANGNRGLHRDDTGSWVKLQDVERALAARQPVGKPVEHACTNCDRKHVEVICPTCAGIAWDNGRLHEFHEVRELSTSLGEGVLDHLLPEEWHEKPLLRFQGAFDEGDRSVGIGERCGNVLAADQSGTVLGDYLASRAAKEGGQ